MALLNSKLQVHKPGHGCTSTFGSINRCRASLCTQRTPQHPAGIAHGSFGSLQLANAPVRLQQVAAVVASQSGTPPPPRAAKKKAKKLVDINGDVSKDLGNGMFQIKLENGVTVMAHLSGKIRQNRIKIVTGDKVTVELSPYDLTKGRLTYRFKPGEYERLQQAAAAGAEAASQSK